MDLDRFGRGVAKRRKEMHLNQAALAKKASISRIYLSQIERGIAKNISTNIVEQLENALESTMGDLVILADSPTTYLTTSPSITRSTDFGPPSETELVEWLSRLPERWKRVLGPTKMAPDVVAVGSEGTTYLIQIIADRSSWAKAEAEIKQALEKAEMKIVRYSP